MNRIKIWPHVILVVLAVAAIAGTAAVIWNRFDRSAEAKELPNAARVERVDGQVGVNQSRDNSDSQWVTATTNTPITVGDRIYTRENSRSEIAFSGRNFATIQANTSLDVLDLSSQRTQVALRNGSGLFEVGSLTSSELFEVATPCGAVDLEKPGVYQISIDDAGNATATAFSGEAQIVGQNGSGRIEKGENLAISCESGSQAVISRLDPDQAGTVLDGYYRTRYPRIYDGRYRNYSAYLSDPYYYDPSNRYVSYNYVNDDIPGVYDLDDYGDWQNVSDYGYCWHPRVANDWAPYQTGYWTMDYPYGLTWVSSEPWGYAPYHYGRWAYTSNEWFWVPDSRRTYPTYSPALVAFIPFGDSSVGWVALGPSDPYVPRYYDSNWQAVYSGRRDVIVNRTVNINVPGAVTVVPVQQFGRNVDPRIINRVDPQTFARVRPVLDPLAVAPLRRAALETRQGRARFEVPQSVEQRILNRSVIAGVDPRASTLRRDLARNLRVESIPDRARNQNLRIADQRETSQRRAQSDAFQGSQPNLAAEQARERQMAELARQSARGDRNARQQMQDLRKQQIEQQRADRVNAQQAQGERVNQQMQQQQTLRQQQQVQREAARQQMITTQQQRNAAVQQQIQSQRQQRRQMEIQRAPAARSSQQQQPLRSQPQPQRIERRPPPQYRPPAQPRVIAPQQRQVRQPQQQAPPRAAPQEMRQQSRPRPPQMRQQPGPQPARNAAPKVQPQPPQPQPRPPAQQKGRGKKPPER